MRITVDIDVPVPMRDGTILRANIYRLAEEGRRSVLLLRLPYGKDQPRIADDLDPMLAVRRGYVVIVQDIRGCGASDGVWDGLVSEADDGFDTIAWAAQLPYADGQVGMFGGSYMGFAQWTAARAQPPALRAIAPIATHADPLNGLIYRGGAFELGLAASFSLLMALPQLLRRHGQDRQALQPAVGAWVRTYDSLGPGGFASLPLREFAPLRSLETASSFFDSIRAAMDRSDEQVASITILGTHDRVHVPALIVGCWYDIFLADTFAHYKALHAQGNPTKLLIGPWVHGKTSMPIGERSFGFGSQAATIDMRTDLGNLQLRWFDHWLKGRDTGMLAEPPVTLFVMGANVWRDEQDWPLSRAVPTAWYLRENFALSPEPPSDAPTDDYQYDPADPVPTLGGAVLILTPENPAGVFDQQTVEARPDVLTYTSAPLGEDTEVTGPITVHLWAASSATDTDFVARLTDVGPDGRSFNLTDGIVRARHRNFASGEPPTLIEPGKPYAYVIDLWATSNVFQAGHRIRLQITSSCFPRWDRNPNTGHAFGDDAEMEIADQTILHDRDHPSRVILPLVPAGHGAL